MANTTNFGWETPDDTDLVKDGALAIRTLGSAIDTSLVDLKGGTTGQVLAKASNTDMDFTWTSDQVGIPASTVDAKGDLIAGTADNTVSRLAAGTNEHRLVADSGQTTGLKYVADTTNYAIAAKGDLLAGTGADTLTALSVGTNGQVLTADSTTATGLKWDTAASSGGWTLISTTTLSSTETTISSIPTTYKRLVFVIYDVTASGGTGVFRGGPNGSYTITNGVTNNNGATLSAEIDFIRFCGSGGAGGMDANDGNNCWTLTIDNYTSTTAYKSFDVYGGFKIGGGVRKFSLAMGSIDTNSAITSMAFKFDTGVSFNSGTVDLYGVK